jgi:general secretion pathway protein I
LKVSVSKALRGFTLVEVLVALAIVAIALGAGLRVSGSQINNAQRQGDMFRAQLCAENELIKLRLTRQLPDTGDKTFSCEQAGVILEGKLHVEATPNPSFRKVDSVVYQAVGDDRQAYTLVKLSTLAGRF